MQAFKSHGIKSITMDDIAVSLGISKRTLYEVFANKEMLLEACILKEREDMKAYVDEMLATSDHVLRCCSSFICIVSNVFMLLIRVSLRT